MDYGTLDKDQQVTQQALLLWKIREQQYSSSFMQLRCLVFTGDERRFGLMSTFMELEG